MYVSCKCFIVNGSGFMQDEPNQEQRIGMVSNNITRCLKPICGIQTLTLGPVTVHMRYIKKRTDGPVNAHLTSTIREYDQT